MAEYNSVILLGPTAVGKTSIGVNLAYHYDWDIISADSRQVYKGLDLGSGKDLKEYTVNGKDIPHHLIDITTLHSEYNVFMFQQDFYRLFNEFLPLNKMPFVVGGTGMYVDAIIRGYELAPVPPNPAREAELNSLDIEELDKILLSLKPNLHNMSDLKLKDRVIKAILIAEYMNSEEYKANQAKVLSRPDVKPFVIGTSIPRDKLHDNIRIRLIERIEQGMIEEVKELHEKQGFSWERLEKLGLEYRFVSLYLEGKIESKEEMTEQLYHAISQFAKRQETWFRGMERKGVKINWLPYTVDKEARISEAVRLIDSIL